MPFVLPGVIRIPRLNDFLEGALLEPVNTVLKAIRMLSLLRGDSVLVAGQGPIGLMFTRLLQLRGIHVLATDLMATRLKFAKQFGAKHAWNASDPALPSRIRKWTRGRGLDAAIIAVPSQEAVLQAQSLLRGGGRLLLFAHTKRGDSASIDLSTICVDEKSLLGSYSSDFTLQKEVARLLFSRKLDARKLVSHEFPLEKTAEAIALAAKPSPGSLKIVVRPDLT